MNLHRRIVVPDLPALQEQVIKLIPAELYKSPRVFYPSDQSAFFEIPELVALLNLHALRPADTNFGFYVMSPFGRSVVHMDWGKSDYSMNIPLINCNNTFTSFYKSSKEPELIPARTINGLKFTPHYSFNNATFEEIDKFESTLCRYY